MLDNNNKTIDYVLRDYDPDQDEAFLYSSFLESYKHSPIFDMCVLMSRDHQALAANRKDIRLDQMDHNELDSFLKAHFDHGYFYKYHRVVLRELLKDSLVTVACATDKPDVILGWSAGNTNRLVYIYVKKMFRNMGIGSALMDKLCGTITDLPVGYLFHTKASSGFLGAYALKQGEYPGDMFFYKPLNLI